jgi:hypothetical protein
MLNLRRAWQKGLVGSSNLAWVDEGFTIKAKRTPLGAG